jgi:hypothetical protein
MPENNSTAVSAGRATGNCFSGGRQVLGKTKGLWEFVFKSDTKDQVAMYLRSTDAIADYVGVEYSRDMRMLIKKGTVRSFNEPSPPKDTVTSLELEKYKPELSIYHKLISYSRNRKQTCLCPCTNEKVHIGKAIIHFK